MQRRIRCAEHRTWPIAASVLDEDGRGIDAFTGNIFQRHGPTPGRAIPVADLQNVANDVVIGQLASAILAAPNGYRHRPGDRANPDFTVQSRRGPVAVCDRYRDVSG